MTFTATVIGGDLAGLRVTGNHLGNIKHARDYFRNFYGRVTNIQEVVRLCECCEQPSEEPICWDCQQVHWSQREA